MVIPRLAGLLCMALAPAADAADYVVVISIDGLRPEAIQTLGAAGAPNFARLQAEGAWTHNARTDQDWTWTVPNHCSMVTARPVNNGDGHNYTSNSNPSLSATLHRTKGSYVASVFDVAHDHGKKTAFYYSKSKLVIIDQSYTASTGADDTEGVDNGKDKIDFASRSTASTSSAIAATFVADLATELFGFAFLHLIDPDPAGHSSRWQTSGYYTAVTAADGYIGDVLNTIETTPTLADNTHLIITTDHGGAGSAHSDITDPENYVIPFYVWGPEVQPGADLYALNPQSRSDPGGDRVPYSAPGQPIRNCDCSNLALDLLGLPPIPGSIINAAQDLAVSAARIPPVFAATATLDQSGANLSWTPAEGDVVYRVQVSDDGENWADASGIWPISELEWTDPAPASERLYRVQAELP